MQSRPQLVQALGLPSQCVRCLFNLLLLGKQLVFQIRRICSGLGYFLLDIVVLLLQHFQLFLCVVDSGLLLLIGRNIGLCAAKRLNFLLRRRKLALRRTESSGKFAIHLRTESK